MYVCVYADQLTDIITCSDSSIISNVLPQSIIPIDLYYNMSVIHNHQQQCISHTKWQGYNMALYDDFIHVLYNTFI